MGKILVVVAGMLGMLMLINMFIPQAWNSGFTILGHKIVWGLVLMVGFLYIAWGLKS